MRGGTAVDAAIAALFCNGVVNSQSMGIGGGFLMTVVLANGTKLALVARETAPAAATEDMYAGNKTASTTGPMAGGVPGEVAGYWAAKQRLGNPLVSWASLIEPSIKLCNEGIPVNNHAAKQLQKKRDSHIKRDPGLREIFINPSTGDVWKEGDSYTSPALGRTLARLAADGGDEFYRGETARLLVEDISEAGGIITRKDLEDYRVAWEEPVTTRLPGLGYTLLSSPPPGSGAVMASILGVVAEYGPGPADRDNTTAWHRFVEACKYAFARRTVMGDWAYPPIQEEVRELVQNLTSAAWFARVRGLISDRATSQDPADYGAEFSATEDGGTAHVSVLSPAGDAVAVTSTVNLIYGSKFMSARTGVILNNQMDDFSSPGITNSFGIPPSANNFISPGKRPVSSMSPSVVVDAEGRVVAVVGASGGSKIITAVAQVLYRTLFLGQDVKEAVDERRLHHQLVPMNLRYEVGMRRGLVEGLAEKGHNMTLFPLGGSIVQGIFVDTKDGTITANADFRKGGTVAGF